MRFADMLTRVASWLRAELFLPVQFLTGVHRTDALFCKVCLTPFLALELLDELGRTFAAAPVFIGHIFIMLTEAFLEARQVGFLDYTGGGAGGTVGGDVNEHGLLPARFSEFQRTPGSVLLDHLGKVCAGLIEGH